MAKKSRATVAHYAHPAPVVGEQAPDTKPGNYYVSVVDGPRQGLLLGPFAEHADALAAVPAARAKACEVNIWATFYGFGTCRMAEDFREPGKLNGLLPETAGLGAL